MYLQLTSLSLLPDSTIQDFDILLPFCTLSLSVQAGKNFTDTILSRTCGSPMNFLGGGLTFLDKSPQGLFWISPFYLGFLLCGLRDNTV